MVVAGYLGSLGVPMAACDLHPVSAAVVAFLAVCCALTFAAPAKADQLAPAEPAWKLVRSVQNPYGGSQDLVLIPEHKRRDREYYLAIGDAICGERKTCSVNFWTDPSHIPASANMPVADLAVMTASYERSPRYTTPHLRLSCALYPSREVAELNNCQYSPGATMPWKSPTDDSVRLYQ